LINNNSRPFGLFGNLFAAKFGTAPKKSEIIAQDDNLKVNGISNEMQNDSHNKDLLTGGGTFAMQHSFKS